MNQQPAINPEWVKCLERELEEARQARDEWIWAYTLVQGILQRHPEWKTAKTCGVFGANVVPLEAAVLAKNLNMELDSIRSELDKFKTVNAYCHMASLDL